jgi:hypothetical protein
MQRHIFSHKELAEALIIYLDIHEGYWAIYVEFGLSGANIPTEDGECPAAIIPILRIGLQQRKTTDALTVDAAEVNPE